MTISIERVVAFLGPLFSIVAGGVAAWLVARVNLVGVLGLDQAQLASQIAAGLSGLTAAVLTWLGQQQWLKGQHIILQAQAQAATLLPSDGDDSVHEATLGGAPAQD